MGIRSSTLAEHRFPTVRKRGYDPIEVDAVMKRLAETLSEYEAATERLDGELSAAEESSEAIKRTFLAAQRTRDEMIGEARRSAQEIAAMARAEAKAVLYECEQRAAATRAETVGEADALVAVAELEREHAVMEAAAMRDEMYRLMNQRRRSTGNGLPRDREADRRRESEALAASAITELTAVADRAGELAKSAKTDAEDRLAAAQARSDEILTMALREADEITRGAREEHSDLLRRAADLRRAVADVERELQKIAGTALERVGFIGGLLELNSPDHHTVPPRAADRTTAATDTPPAEASLATGVSSDGGGSGGSSVTLDLTDAPATRARTPNLATLRGKRAEPFPDPDGSGRPPAARPLVEATRGAEAGNDGRDDDDTINQRRGGGIRRRNRQDPAHHLQR